MRTLLLIAMASCQAWFTVVSPLQAQDLTTRVAGEYKAEDSLQMKLESADETAKRSLEHLSWNPASFSVSVETVSSSPTDVDFLVRFPSPKPIGDATIDQVCCEWYCPESSGDASAPAVVVLHESGSRMVVGRIFAQELRRRGVHAFLLQMPGYGQRKSSELVVDDLIAVFVQGIADARRSRDAIAVLPGIAADRIGLQGTSLGGFAASVAAGLDNGFHSVFLCLSGGDLYSVLTSGEREARKAMDRLLALGIKAEDLQERLAPVEPLTLASRLNPEKTWLYSATFDRVVPPRNATLLANAIGLSETHHIRLLATHYSGIIYLPGMCDKIARVVRIESLSD